MTKRKNKFTIPSPQKKLEEAINHLSKYSVGERGISFHSIKKLKPVFAFDYLSLDKSSLCINKKSNKVADLLGFFEGLKKISSFTYEEMKYQKSLRFHSIDLQDKNVNLSQKKLLNVLAPSQRGMTEEELPTLYQFDLQYQIQARAVGFLFKGIFYIIWYDKDHIIYKN